MEAKHIKRLYEAMDSNGFESMELELGKNNRIKLQLDGMLQTHMDLSDSQPELAEDPVENTQIEIRSDKVGTFYFGERILAAGDRIASGEILGSIKGISFKDQVKCSVEGTIRKVEVGNGTIVDYGRLLLVVDID